MLALLFLGHRRDAILHGEVLRSGDAEAEVHLADVVLDEDADVEVHTLGVLRRAGYGGLDLIDSGEVEVGVGYRSRPREGAGGVDGEALIAHDGEGVAQLATTTHLVASRHAHLAVGRIGEVERTAPLCLDVVRATCGEVSADAYRGIYVDRQVYIEPAEGGGGDLDLLREEGIGEVYELDELIGLLAGCQRVFAHDVGAARTAEYVHATADAQ